ncbi:hypothetical protein HKCCE2091_03735 [Rhodobacterales bacterium HKCCE2091]|nr:hypothetical protein [Rhodobacterales bacterium HKCCE2091]
MTVQDSDLNLVADNARKVLSEAFASRDLHRHFDGDETVARRLWSLSTEMGWIAAILPERVGGLGLGVTAGARLLREFGRFAVPGELCSSAVAAMFVASAGEGGAAADGIGEALATGAIRPFVPGRTGGGSLALEGGAVSGTVAGLIGGRDGDTALVPVSGEGPMLALLRIDGRAAAFTADDIWDRTRTIGTLTCRDAEPEAILEGGGGTLRTFTRLAVAADCVGMHEMSLERTVDYARSREQFGRPIGSFQALKHRMAEMRIALEVPIRLLDHAATLCASGANDAATWVALARSQASDASIHAAEEETLLHGGVGYTWDFDCHIRLKRAMLNASLGGRTSDVRDDAFGGLMASARRVAEAEA